MSKGQLTITAEKARALSNEDKFAQYIPPVERIIVAAATKGDKMADLGLWTVASGYLQKRLENNGFSVVATTERGYTCGERGYTCGETATRLKVSWEK